MPFQLFEGHEGLPQRIEAQSEENRELLKGVIHRFSFAARRYCGTSGKSTEWYRQKLQASVSVFDARSHRILQQKYSADQHALKHYNWCCEKKSQFDDASFWNLLQKRFPDKKNQIYQFHDGWTKNSIFAEHSSQALRDIAENILPLFLAYFTFSKQELKNNKRKIKKEVRREYYHYIRENTAWIEYYQEKICDSISQRIRNCYENKSLSNDDIMTSFVTNMKEQGLYQEDVAKLPSAIGMKKDDRKFLMDYFKKHATKEQKKHFSKAMLLENNQNYRQIKRKKSIVLAPAFLVKASKKNKTCGKIFKKHRSDLLQIQWLDDFKSNDIPVDRVFHCIDDIEKVKGAIDRQRNIAKHKSGKKLWGLFHSKQKKIYKSWLRALDDKTCLLNRIQSQFYHDLLSNLEMYADKDFRKLYRKAFDFFQGRVDSPKILLQEKQKMLVESHDSSQSRLRIVK